MKRQIDPDDVRVETMRGSGKGGQNRNKRDTAVRLMHLPTGITAECQDERSQGQNKAKAWATLQQRVGEAFDRARLQKLREAFPQETRTIRTYNHQRGTVKDHRTGEVADLKDVMDGKYGMERPSERSGI